MSRKCLPRSDSRQCCRPPRQKCTQLRQSCSKSHSRLVRPSLTKDNIFFFCFIYFPFSMNFSFIFMFFSFSAQMYHTALLFSLFSLPTSTYLKIRRHCGRIKKLPVRIFVQTAKQCRFFFNFSSIFKGKKQQFDAICSDFAIFETNFFRKFS